MILLFVDKPQATDKLANNPEANDQTLGELAAEALAELAETAKSKNDLR